MKIYHLLATQPVLNLESGDRINELKFITALSRYAETYYNDQKFDPDAPEHGLNKKEISSPTGQYDLYYVRNNPEIFDALPHPKVCMAYPYYPEAYEHADAILTTTEAWKERLENYNDDPTAADFLSDYYPKKIIPPKKVINIGQILDPCFYPRHGSFLHFRYRARFGYGFIIGYFGRVDNEARPHPDFMAALPYLKKQIPDLCSVFAGNIRTEIPDRSVRVAGKIPYLEMPFANSACDVLLCNEHPEANWLGSGKTLEAMACGVPMVLTPRPARVEQLGETYPLYYRGKDELVAHVMRLFEDRKFYEEVSAYMKERAKQFYPEVMGKKVIEKFEDLIES